MCDADTSGRRFESLETTSGRYDVSVKTVRRWIDEGMFAAYRIGPRLIRVDAREVDEALRPVPTGGIR